MSTELEEIWIPEPETPAGGSLDTETALEHDPESETPDVDERVSDDELDEDELDDDDDQADELDEDEPGIDRPGPSSEAEIEKGYKKLEAEAQRHSRRIGEIMGDAAAELVPCELCGPATPGFRFPVEVQGAQLAAVRAAIGLEEGPKLKADTYSRVCDGCDGWGRVLSGSHVGREATLVCRGCTGRGWVSIGTERDLEIAAAPQLEPAAHGVDDQEPMPDVDAWNTPIGHPEYGVMPQYRRLPLPTFEG